MGKNPEWKKAEELKKSKKTGGEQEWIAGNNILLTRMQKISKICNCPFSGSHHLPTYTSTNTSEYTSGTQCLCVQNTLTQPLIAKSNRFTPGSD